MGATHAEFVVCEQTIDTNHGYSKAPVPNSEIEKRRTTLENRLANTKRWGEKARLASLRARKTSDRRWKRAKVRSRELYSELNGRLLELEALGVSGHEYRERRQGLVDAVEAEMDGHWRGYYRAFDTCNSEYAKWERYRREQRALLRDLEDLAASQKQMYELDNRKDQIMTVLNLALVNLAMRARDNYFPPEYARATLSRLAPFFRLAGCVVSEADRVTIEPRAFNNRRLNRDLAAICDILDRVRPRLPGGRRLHFADLASAGVRRQVRGRPAA